MAERGSAARHTFYYLLALFTLCFTALGVGQILFQIINSLLPETVYSYDTAFDDEILRFGITAVVISAPIFYLCTRAVNRELANGKLDLHSLVRKWLTYLILLLSSVTIIVDLMVAFYSFLSGELTTKFILKAVVILGIAAMVFFYYLYDIGREKFIADDPRIKMYRNIFAVVLVLSLALGFYFNTSPAAVRAEKEDNERVNRLSSIHYQLQEYLREESAMPANLEAIEDQLYDGDITDPVSDEPFTYTATGENTYSICATFEFSNREREDNMRYWRDPDWLHDAGKYCFDKTLDTPVKLREVPLPPSV
jgi:hypothetical protein